MARSMTEILEQEELLQKLIDAGYGELVETFLTQESKVYTRKGRLNKCGACRALGWKPKQLEEVLQKCQEILEGSVD